MTQKGEAMVKKRPTVNLGLADKIVDDGGIDPELQQTPAASEEPEQVSQKPPKKLAKSKENHQIKKQDYV